MRIREKSTGACRFLLALCPTDRNLSDMKSRTFTKAEVAAALRCSERTIDREIARGNVRATKEGRRTVIDSSELEKLRRSRR